MNDINSGPSQHRAKEEHFRLHVMGSGPDWRIWLGLSVTTTWLVLLSLYVANTIGWTNIGNEPIQPLGNFLEGAFAPLAFLWLVIGYFLQKKELMQNTDAIKMQYVEIQKSAEQAVIQTEAIRASEMHARKQSFLQTAESVKQQLGAISAFLFLSSQGEQETTDWSLKNASGNSGGPSIIPTRKGSAARCYSCGLPGENPMPTNFYMAQRFARGI